MSLNDFRSVISRWRRLPLVFHPLLFGLYPVLHLYSQNTDELWPAAAVWPALIVISGIVLAWILVWPLFRSVAKSAIFVTAGVLFFFGYGHAVELLGRVWDGGAGGWTRAIALLPGLVLLAILGRFLIRRPEPGLLTRALHTSAILLIAFPVADIALHQRGRTAWRPPEVSAPRTSSSSAEGQDIYFIVLDAYARTDVLKNLFRYDNRWFIEELERRGFQVQAESRSNYNLTFLSLAATLNMTYIDGSLGNLRRGDAEIPTQMIRHNRVQTFLKQQGYRIVHLASGWAVTDHNPDADVRRGLRGVQEFQFALLRSTLWGTLFPSRLHDDWRELIFFNLRELEKIASMPGPKFVLAHIVCPHEPFVFYPDGSDPRPDFIKEEYRSNWPKRRRYLDNLIFISRRILRVIDEIDSAGGNAVILLQSDHGSASIPYTRPPDPAAVHERLSNLMAWRLGGAEAQRVPEGITPVNSFRFLFDTLFETRLGLLPDRSYYSDPAAPYDLLEATGCCASDSNPFDGIPFAGGVSVDPKIPSD
jgi:hypothetical protein